MALLTRLILICSLLLQSIPGLTADRCASMASAESASSTEVATGSDEACPCCLVGDDSTAASLPSAHELAACQCGPSDSEYPSLPPSNPTSGHLEQFLSLVPTLIGVLPPEPTPAAAIRGFPDQPPHRTTNSMQSLLCVWVM